MSYYAIIDGSAKLKAGFSTKAFEAFHEKWKDSGYEIEANPVDKDGMVVEIHKSGNYHEEDLYSIIGDLKPMIVEESMFVTGKGEDDSFWAVRIEDGNIVETPGAVIYGPYNKPNGLAIERNGIFISLTKEEIETLYRLSRLDKQ